MLERLRMNSFSVDPFIAVYSDSNPFWSVELEDGRTIYQDDDRPGLDPDAWARCKKYIDESSSVIKRIKFRFAGYEHVVYDKEIDDCIGFFFTKGVSALLSQTSTKQWCFYSAGKVYDDGEEVMSVTQYEVPFLEVRECRLRKVTEESKKKIIYFNKLKD